MVWLWQDGQAGSGGQQAGLLMRWRGKRHEMRDMVHMPLARPGPTCCGDEGSPDKAWHWNRDFLPGDWLTNRPQRSPRSLPAVPLVPTSHLSLHLLSIPSPQLHPPAPAWAPLSGACPSHQDMVPAAALCSWTQS